MKEFKVKPNLAVGIWLGALTLVWVYDIVMFVLKSLDQQSFIIVSIFLILHFKGVDIPFSIVDILIGIPQSKKLFSIKVTICSMLLLNTLKHWS